MLKKIFYSLLFSFLIYFNFSSPVLAKDYSFPQVKFKVQVNKDGSFEVQEQRTYKFNGSFSWADLWIPFKNQNYKINNFQIRDESKIYKQNNSHLPATFYTEVSKDKLYAKWFYQASNQTKTFIIRYQDLNGIKLHSDIAEFYWK